MAKENVQFSLQNVVTSSLAQGTLPVKLRVVVADDRTLSADFDIIATASDGRSALDSIRTLKPEIAIVDLTMPSLNGIELTKKAICSPPKPAVVLCSVESHPEIIQHALNAGALAYVFKPRIATDLVAAVKSAAAGRQFVSHV